MGKVGKKQLREAFRQEIFNHDHDDRYSLLDHDHDGDYALVNHNHDGEYASVNHSHGDEYASANHTHNYLSKSGGTIDGGTNTTLTLRSDDSGASSIEVYGNDQGTGRLYVGQSTSHGGGIEYNGDGSPSTVGAGSDYVTLYRKAAGTEFWTARNKYNSNNWEFRGELYANTSDRVFHEGHKPSWGEITGNLGSLRINDDSNLYGAVNLGIRGDHSSSGRIIHVLDKNSSEIMSLYGRGELAVSDNIKVGGSSVWHSGNFDPNNAMKRYDSSGNVNMTTKAGPIHNSLTSSVSSYYIGYQSGGSWFRLRAGYADNANNLDGRSSGSFASSGHNHDGRYVRDNYQTGVSYIGVLRASTTSGYLHLTAGGGRPMRLRTHSGSGDIGDLCFSIEPNNYLNYVVLDDGNGDHDEWTIRTSYNGRGNIGSTSKRLSAVWTAGIYGTSHRDTKEDIEPYDINLAYEQLKDIPLYTYFYKDETYRNRHIGTMMEYMPSEMVSTAVNKEGDVAGWQYDNTIFFTMAATKALQEKVEELEQREAEVEQKEIEVDERLNDLEARLAILEGGS